ncbi:MAG TPA: Hpt domain-containing protein [Bryobacteraceae bacterium]|nr:Hpt domain-containing protein [Bryobacteraceae bacterium]
MEVTFVGGMETKHPGAGDGLDRKAALDRVGGDLDLLKDIAHVFLDDCPRSLEELRLAAARGDCPTVERVAHGLKGAASNFGAGRVVAAGLALEQMARAGKLDNCAAAMATLEGALMVLCSELETLIAS